MTTHKQAKQHALDNNVFIQSYNERAHHTDQAKLDDPIKTFNNLDEFTKNIFDYGNYCAGCTVAVDTPNASITFIKDAHGRRPEWSVYIDGKLIDHYSIQHHPKPSDDFGMDQTRLKANLKKLIK